MQMGWNSIAGARVVHEPKVIPDLQRAHLVNLYTSPMTSFIAFLDDREIFRSSKPWLHPLLDLRSFLETNKSEGTLTTYDRVVGRASALLSAGLGVRKISTRTVSTRAIQVLEHYSIELEAEETVDRILCATEDLLQKTLDPDETLALIRERISDRPDG